MGYSNYTVQLLLFKCITSDTCTDQWYFPQIVTSPKEHKPFGGKHHFVPGKSKKRKTIYSQHTTCYLDSLSLLVICFCYWFHTLGKRGMNPSILTMTKGLKIKFVLQLLLATKLGKKLLGIKNCLWVWLANNSIIFTRCRNSLSCTEHGKAVDLFTK